MMAADGALHVHFVLSNFGDAVKSLIINEFAQVAEGLHKLPLGLVIQVVDTYSQLLQ